MNKSIVILFFLIISSIGNVFANTIRFSLEITGIKVNEGQVHILIYSNDRDYRKNVPYVSFILDSTSQQIIHSFDILEGEYLIALFQDTNDNGELDTNLFGFPKEPVGLSNYTGGVPGGWNKQKMPINNASNRITINIGRV